MDRFLSTLFSALLRVLLVVVGLVFALSLAVVVLALLGVWMLRAGWARLTGRPVTPFVFHTASRAAFEQAFRRAGAAAAAPAESSRTPRADAVTPDRRWLGDVTDVKPK